MRSVRALLLAAALMGTVVSGTAEAATPAQGTLSQRVRLIKWTGSFAFSDPDALPGCLPPPARPPICDRFLLRVDLPKAAQIRIDVAPPNAASDIDFYVYSPTGREIARSAGEPDLSHEAAEFRYHTVFRNKPFLVRIMPWLFVPGATYTGTAEVR